MKHCVFLWSFLCIGILLTSCKSYKAVIEESNETFTESVDTNETLPFLVLIDKVSLETRQKNTITANIYSDLVDWEYTVKAEKGKITNKTLLSFDYTSPTDNEKEDSITVFFSNKETGDSYKYSIPLIFIETTNQEELFNGSVDIGK